MESQKTIDFLPNPKIKANFDQVKVYANLFGIRLTKEIKMYQYPFEVNPEIAKENIPIRQKLFKEPYKQVKSKYGFFLIDGDSLYSLEKVEEIQIFDTTLRIKKEKINYEIK